MDRRKVVRVVIAAGLQLLMFAVMALVVLRSDWEYKNAYGRLGTGLLMVGFIPIYYKLGIKVRASLAIFLVMGTGILLSGLVLLLTNPDDMQAFLWASYIQIGSMILAVLLLFFLANRYPEDYASYEGLSTVDPPSLPILIGLFVPSMMLAYGISRLIESFFVPDLLLFVLLPIVLLIGVVIALIAEQQKRTQKPQ